MFTPLLAVLNSNPQCTGQNLLPDLFSGLRASGKCDVQFTGLNSIVVLLTNIIQILLAVSGIIAVGMIIAGGIFYITSSGDPSRIKKAKDVLVNAIVGLMIVLLAFGAVAYVSSRFQ